jgi:hypothetical protein
MAGTAALLFVILYHVFVKYMRVVGELKDFWQPLALRFGTTMIFATSLWGGGTTLATMLPFFAFATFSTRIFFDS